MTLRACIILLPAVAANAAVVAADSERGAALFESLSCIRCHSVNGEGGKAAPDLGRLVDRNFTPATLAATMWNHAPTMWASMQASDIHAGDLDEQAAADLFAYFYSARFFEPPGDAGRGKRVLERDCARCHGMKTSTDPAIPTVMDWKSVNSPFELVATIWNHLPGMEAAAARKRAALPTLSGQDLVDLLVYVRDLPRVRDTDVKFETTSGAEGPALFQSKGCAGCHKAGSELAARIKGRTLTEIAAAMWNHGPAMRSAGATPSHFTAEEMRELLSYLWARQFFEATGDKVRGARVFSVKGCAGCHTDPTSGAPRLTGVGREFSGAAMVSALWRHGSTMLEAMKKQGKPWPHFNGREMSDLIGYLSSGTGPK
jgi:mono/diheme cytochrome c family protein